MRKKESRNDWLWRKNIKIKTNNIIINVCEIAFKLLAGKPAPPFFSATINTQQKQQQACWRKKERKILFFALFSSPLNLFNRKFTFIDRIYIFFSLCCYSCSAFLCRLYTFHKFLMYYLVILKAKSPYTLNISSVTVDLWKVYQIFWYLDYFSNNGQIF